MISSSLVLCLLTWMYVGAESGTVGALAFPARSAQAVQDPVAGLPVEAVELEPLREEGERERPEGAVAGAVADEVLQTWNYGGRSESSHVSNRASYHPGTRVVVDASPRGRAQTRSTKDGSKVGARLLAGLRNRGYWPFRNCYEQEVREVADPGGKTELLATFSADGKVIAARPLRTNLKKQAIAHCIGAELRTLRLDKPLGRRLDAFVSVAIWPGDLPLLPLPRQAKPEARKPTRYRDVDRALASLIPVFAECLAPARRGDPKLWGRLALGFTVDAEGRATEFAESTSRFGDAQARSCIVSVLATLTWPQPRNGTRLEFALRLAKPDLSSYVLPPISGEGSAPSPGMLDAAPKTGAGEAERRQPSPPPHREHKSDPLTEEGSFHRSHESP